MSQKLESMQNTGVQDQNPTILSPQNIDPYAKPDVMTDQLPSPGAIYKESSDGPTLGQSARSKFTIRVFILVTLQLLMTSAIGAITYNVQAFGKIVVHPAVYVIASVGMITISFMAICCKQTFRKYGLPLFTLFTLFTSFLLSVCLSMYKAESILIAFAAAFIISLALTLYAWKTKSDFTGWGPYLFVALICLCFFGITAIFVRQLSIVYSGLCVIAFGAYLVYDVQLVLGRGQYSYSLDEGYLAAMNIYLDIINMFIHILRLVGSRS